MLSLDFTRAALCTACALALALAFGAPAPLAQTAAPSTYQVMVRSVPLGSEQIAVERFSDGWAVSSSGRVAAPVDVILRTFNARYDNDWKPRELTIDITLRGQAVQVHTIINGSTATTRTTVPNAAPVEETAQIDPAALLLPNPLVGPYQALAARLRTAAPGTTIPIFQPPQGSFQATVGESTTERIKTLDRIINARLTHMLFNTPGSPPLPVDIWADENGRLLRVSIPAQGVEFAREDIASVSTRKLTMSRPNDEDVRIPANGFSLAGTLSKPADATTTPLPAVILIAGSGQTDRDETIFNIPIFGQLANTFADAGFAVLRYDKRGVGQSGGRPEAATLADFAEDAKAAIKLMSDRKDIDRKRIAVVGHSEGGSVGMLAAAKNDRVAALVLVATIGVTGKELNLYQVTHNLERSDRSEAEKQATIELQKKIQEAVLTGNGWDKIELPAGVRQQADTPWFQSYLAFDPAKTMRNVEQPLLIVQGELDTQVPPSNADRLQELASARKKAPPSKVVKVPAVNHLLVPAKSGEFEEYNQLGEAKVSPAVSGAIVSWLKETLRVP
jgi:pimeloyl-ACP methyl ester carboxylesterase